MLAVETILGALTGYMTNDIAIRQLFSKNGIVVREREQFITLLVRVLKEQILTEDIISEMRDNPKIIGLFDESLSELLKEKLPAIFSASTMADFDEGQHLKNIIHEHLNRISLEQSTIDEAYLHHFIGAVIGSEDFKNAFLNWTNKSGALSLEKCGMREWYEDVISPLRQLSIVEWHERIDKERQRLSERLSSLSREQIAAFLNGITAENMGQFIENILQKKAIETSFLTKDEAFREQLYGWTKRLIPELFGLHFQSLLEMFYPFVKEERFVIERMTVESIKEADPQATLLNEAALGMVQRFFADDKEGNDWVTRLYLQYSEEKEQQNLCIKLTNWTQGRVLTLIDRWRQSDQSQLLTDTVWFKKGKGLLVRALTKLLPKLYEPAYFTRFCQVFCRGLAHILKKYTTAADACSWLDHSLADKWHKTIQEQFFSASSSEAAYAKIVEWWQVNGKKCLLKYKEDLQKTQAKEQIITQLVDKVYQMPLAYFMEQGVASIAFDDVSNRARKFVFSHASDFLAALTRKQLEQLSREDIRRLVLEMMGKEMRPLSYLGGVIGAAAGALTSVAVQMSGTQFAPEQMEEVALLLAARSGVYGAVGYGTNVMAIKGLFWPYKKMLGMQGLISANQMTFAKKMQALTKDYVINDAIWETQVQKVSDLYEVHHEQWISQAFHAINRKRSLYIQPYYQSFLSKQVTHFVKEKCRAEYVAKGVLSFGKNEITTQSQAFAQQMMMQRIPTIWQRGLANIYHKEYDEQYFSKKGDTLLQSININTVQDKVVSALSTVRWPKTRESYEALWTLCQPIYATIPEKLLAHKQQLIEKIDKKIYQRLSFPLQLTYKMVGGKHYIEKVMVYFTENKLPLFLVEEQEQVEKLAIQWCQEEVAGKPVLETVYPVSIEEAAFLLGKLQKISQTRIQQALLSGVGALGQKKEIVEKICALAEAVWTVGIFDEWIVSLVDSKHTSAFLTSFFANTGTFWQPMVAVLSKQLPQLSLPKTLSMSDEYFWQCINKGLECNEEEKKIITDFTHHLLTASEPVLFSYVSKQGQQFIELVDVPNLTYQSICALSPEALEALVREIAQPYFTHVERMGWLGAVVAIPATAFSMMIGNI